MFLILALTATSCSTVPKDMTVITEGQVKTKLLVRDLKNKKSHILDMNIKALESGPMRMDVTGTLGVHLFSLVTNNDNVEYMLVRQKKYYSGINSKSALKPILKMPLNPNHLRNIVFQKPISDKGWTCTSDESGKLRDCMHLRDRLKVIWKENKEGRPLVLINYPRVAQIKMQIKGYEKYEGDPEKTFKLKVPKSFKSYKL